MNRATEILVLVLTLAVTAVGYVWSKFRRIPLIPGINAIVGSRFWGSAHLFFPIDGSIDSQLKVKELVMTKGKIFQFYVFNRLFVLVNDGKLAKHIFDQIRNKGVRTGRGGISMEKNILSLDTNDEWKRRRNQFRHAFTTAGLRVQGQLFGSLVSKFLDKLNQDCVSQPIIPIDQLFGRFALNSIFAIGFEMEIELLNDLDKFNELNGAIQIFFKHIWIPNVPFAWMVANLPDFLPVPKAISEYKAASKTLRKYELLVLENLRKKHAEGSFSTNSFGKLLMEFVDQEKPSYLDLLSELRIFIIAGFETTAHTLSWIIYSLCKNPEIQKKCQLIVDDWFEQHAPSDALSMLTPLPDYLEAVIKESMRKYPVAARGSARYVVDPKGFLIEVEKGQPPIVIPQGAFVLVNFFALHNDPDIWGADAAEFNPDRWKSSALLSSPGAYAGTGVRPDEITFAPFSAGVRNCIGMNFALWEIRSLTLNLVRHFSFEFVDEQFQHEELAMMTDVTMKPLNQLPVKVTKRCYDAHRRDQE